MLTPEYITKFNPVIILSETIHLKHDITTSSEVKTYLNTSSDRLGSEEEFVIQSSINRWQQRSSEDIRRGFDCQCVAEMFVLLSTTIKQRSSVTGHCEWQHVQLDVRKRRYDKFLRLQRSQSFSHVLWVWDFVMRLWPCPICNRYIIPYALPATINACGFLRLCKQQEHQSGTGDLLDGGWVFLTFQCCKQWIQPG